MIVIIFWIMTFFCLIITPVYGAPDENGVSAGEEPVVIERTIRIEGTVEKPRIIFIVPRAKLWKEDLFYKKSFTTNILHTVYPEHLIRDGTISNPDHR